MKADKLCQRSLYLSAWSIFYGQACKCLRIGFSLTSGGPEVHVIVVNLLQAWIRLALNDGLMESYLATMFRDENTLRAYYKRTAYLRDVEQNTIMLSCIQGSVLLLPF